MAAVDPRHRRVIDGELSLDVGSVVLDQHVGLCHELLQDRNAVGLTGGSASCCAVAMEFGSRCLRAARRPRRPPHCRRHPILIDCAPSGEPADLRWSGVDACQVEDGEARECVGRQHGFSLAREAARRRSARFVHGGAGGVRACSAARRDRERPRHASPHGSISHEQQLLELGLEAIDDRLRFGAPASSVTNRTARRRHRKMLTPTPTSPDAGTQHRLPQVEPQNFSGSVGPDVVMTAVAFFANSPRIASCTGCTICPATASTAKASSGW